MSIIKKTDYEKKIKDLRSGKDPHSQLERKVKAIGDKVLGPQIEDKK